MVADDPVFKPQVLRRILLKRGGDVCGVAEVSSQCAGTGRLAGTTAYCRFLGVRGFLFMGFYTRLLRVLSRLPLPSFITCRLSIAGACASFRVPREYVHDINAPDFMKRLSAVHPDVIISCQGQIFSSELLGMARIACINCHPSKLPKYRGKWPIFAAMLDGEATIGISAHTMTARIDSGIILCQKEFTASKHHSFMDNYAYAHELYADVILEALDLIERREISGCTQVPVDAPYYRAPSAEDMRRFRSSGLRMM